MEYKKSITELLTDKVNDLIEGTDLFLIEIKIKPTNNVKVFLDGDQGVTIETVSKINKALYKLIEEDELYPDGDFSLEVSSAGLDSPLQLFRQYQKNVGRKIEVTMHDDSVLEGLMKEANEDYIVLDVPEGKKKEIKEYKIVLSNVKKAIVQISF